MRNTCVYKNLIAVLGSLDTGASNFFFFAINRDAGMTKNLVGTNICGGLSLPLPLDLNKINAGTSEMDG